MKSNKSMNIYILTGEKGSGKTTKLHAFLKTKSDYGGILSPIVDGERTFLNLAKNQYFPMKASADEARLVVGSFQFSLTAFITAGKILSKAWRAKTKWWVLDEIGPLEMQGKGFDLVFESLLTKPWEVSPKNLILVVRKGMEENVMKRYEFTATIINKEDLDGLK